MLPQGLVQFRTFLWQSSPKTPIIKHVGETDPYILKPLVSFVYLFVQINIIFFYGNSLSNNLSYML